jgi:hypothetical protein
MTRFTATQLGALRVEELRDLLRQRDLKVGGTKEELIARLLSHQAAAPEAADGAVGGGALDDRINDLQQQILLLELQEKEARLREAAQQRRLQAANPNSVPSQPSAAQSLPSSLPAPSQSANPQASPAGGSPHDLSPLFDLLSRLSRGESATPASSQPAHPLLIPDFVGSPALPHVTRARRSLAEASTA